MYISPGNREADEEKIRRLQELLAKATRERNAALTELAVMRQDRTDSGNEALEMAATRLEMKPGLDIHRLETVKWLRSLAKE